MKVKVETLAKKLSDSTKFSEWFGLEEPLEPHALGSNCATPNPEVPETIGQEAGGGQPI